MAVKKKKKNTKISSWIVHIKTTSNNTHITLTDKQWNKVLWGGTGSLGFKGAKKSTPYAAEQLTKSIMQEAKDNMWLQEIGVIARGTGLGRDGTFKGINDIWGIDILWIKEDTWIQHGWCKGKRQKRN